MDGSFGAFTPMPTDPWSIPLEAIDPGRAELFTHGRHANGLTQGTPARKGNKRIATNNKGGPWAALVIQKDFA